jgi:hypothetical protein
VIGDIDGDGLADLLYVADRHVLCWLNRSGGTGATPPTATAATALRSSLDATSRTIASTSGHSDRRRRRAT